MPNRCKFFGVAFLLEAINKESAFEYIVEFDFGTI